MKSFIENKLKVIAILAMAGVMALSSAVPAFADSQAQINAEKTGLFGAVVSKDEDSFMIETKQGNMVDLMISDSTVFRIPGEQQADFDDLKKDNRVAILVQNEGNSQTAVKVMIIPGQPQRQHRTLTVLEVDGNRVIAEDADGNQVEVELDHQVSADIAGELTTFVTTKGGSSNMFKAKAEMKIENVIRRLEKHANALESEIGSEPSAEAKAKKEEKLASLQTMIQASSQRRVDAMTKAIDRVPEQARPALERALDSATRGLKKDSDNRGKPDDLQTPNGKP